jgi:hypothetical protein
MNVEMRLAAGKRHLQHAAAFRIRFCGRELELGAIELVRDPLSQTYIWQKAPCSSGRCCAAL